MDAFGQCFSFPARMGVPTACFWIACSPHFLTYFRKCVDQTELACGARLALSFWIVSAVLRYAGAGFPGSLFPTFSKYFRKCEDQAELARRAS